MTCSVTWRASPLGRKRPPQAWQSIRPQSLHLRLPRQRQHVIDLSDSITQRSSTLRLRMPGHCGSGKSSGIRLAGGKRCWNAYACQGSGRHREPGGPVPAGKRGRFSAAGYQADSGASRSGNSARLFTSWSGAPGRRSGRWP